MNGSDDRILILPVKPVVQVNHYECGVACVQTILRSKGVKTNRLSIKKQLRSNPRFGTYSDNIISLLLSQGLKTKERVGANLGDIETELKKGKLCIVAYQAWGYKKYFKKLQSGHYSVVFGYEKDFLWLADPYVKGDRVRYKRGVRKIRRDVFEGRWMASGLDRWYLAV